MRVKDMIDSHHPMPGFTTKFVVEPKGTSTVYYDSENHLTHHDVAEMKIKFWFLCGAKKNRCDLVIIVDRDEEFEARRKRKFEQLTGHSI